MGSHWIFDERSHAGEEHLEPEQARRYDEKLPFDPTPEVETLREYGLTSDHLVIDFGTGTGAFPLAIASECDRVIGVDISESMLAVASDKLRSAGIDNVDLVESGLLTYSHNDRKADVAFSKDVLHHLPDFWKLDALTTIGGTMREGGILRLRDFVFSFDPGDARTRIDAWIDEQRASTSFSDEEIYTHFRDEFSTYGFLQEDLLRSAGFEILEAEYPDEFYATYVCRWLG